MTHMLPPARDARRLPGAGFWRKTWAMLVKEFIQLRRDRVSFAMIIMIPLIQLLLFGYAINTTPRNLPTAVLMQETSDLSRSILAAIRNTKYFRVTHLPHSEAEVDQLLASGSVLFAIEMPHLLRDALAVGFGRAKSTSGIKGSPPGLGPRYPGGRRPLGGPPSPGLT